jgi:putative CRISPR-associated protein (TIGR02619 family)
MVRRRGAGIKWTTGRDAGVDLSRQVLGMFALIVAGRKPPGARSPSEAAAAHAGYPVSGPTVAAGTGMPPDVSFGGSHGYRGGAARGIVAQFPSGTSGREAVSPPSRNASTKDLPMSTPVLMVSTCGISALANSNRDQIELLNSNANQPDCELDSATRGAIDSCICKMESRLNAIGHADLRRESAELNGILGWYSEAPQATQGPPDQHILLHSDTYLGQRVAECLADRLRKLSQNTPGIIVQTQSVPKLRTSNLADFRESLNFLVSWCDETLPVWRGHGYRTVFNLTGAFKSLAGFMQVLGMFHADEMIYVFETGNEMLRIPRIPLDIESALTETFENNLPLFRKLDDERATCERKEIQALPEMLFFELQGEAELSAWGRLAWRKYKSELYQSTALPSISHQLAISEAAENQAKQLERPQLHLFNQRMDDLARYLDSGRKRSLQRLDFKKLQGNPKPPSDHECDLWSGSGGWRAFGHFDGDTFVVDSIGPHL